MKKSKKLEILEDLVLWFKRGLVQNLLFILLFNKLFFVSYHCLQTGIVPSLTVNWCKS